MSAVKQRSKFSLSHLLSYTGVSAFLSLALVSAPAIVTPNGDSMLDDCVTVAYADNGNTSSGNDGNSSESKRDWNYSRCKEGQAPAKTNNQQQPASSAQSANGSATSSGSNDWLTPGTQAYNTAQAMFNHLTGHLGASGVTAAAIVGSIQPESNFKLDAAELGGLKNVHVKYSNQAGPCAPSAGSYDGTLSFGIDNKQPVCGMAWYPRAKPMLGGGGLFQTTPYTLFTDSPYWGKFGPGWSAENQLEYLFESNIWTRNIERSCYTYGGKAPNLRGTFTVESWLQMTDPAQAENIFYLCELKGWKYATERMDLARKANEVFNAANVPADPSKWKIGKASSAAPSATGGTVSATGATPSSDSSGRPVDPLCAEDCKPGDAKNLTAGVAGPSSAVTTGSNAWKSYESLPDELKKDAVDFTRFGMQPGVCEAGNWQKSIALTAPGLLNQCVAFSRMAAHVMWSKNGQPLNPPRGNGGVLAKNFASGLGGSVTKTPTRGAIGSWPKPGKVGHTMIILQVYSDGRLLIAEQNTSLSGQGAGTLCDWNYRMYDAATAAKLEFFDPASVGYTLSLDGSGSAAVNAGSVMQGAAALGDQPLSGGIADTSASCSATANTSLMQQFNNASSDSAAVLLAARVAAGRPYVYGAMGPSSFDCSGLVYWSYKQATQKDLNKECGGAGRTAADQQNCLRSKGLLKMDMSQCKAGDITFWGTPAHHVGFVVDDGLSTIFHAPRTGDVVKEAKMYGQDQFGGCGPLP